METFLAMLPEVLTATAAETGTALAADAAATGLAETALTDAALTTLPEAATAALPEVATAAVPEAATAAVPEVADASQGILQANNAALDTSMGPGNMGATNIPPTENLMQTGANGINSGATGVNEITGQAYDVTQGVPQSGQINTQDLIKASNGAPSQGIPTQALDKGIYDPFREGAQTASDMFSKIGDKLGKGMDYVEAHPKSSFAAALAAGKIYDKLFPNGLKPPPKYTGPLSKYHLAGNYQPAGATPIHYTPHYAAQGGIMRLAMGGPATTPQPGQMYPQSQQDHTQFAVPSQMPTSAEIVNSGYEPQTNPYTGNQPLGMAAGGETSNPLIDLYKEKINPKFKEAPSADTGIYTDTDADTATQDALAAANTRAKKIDFMTKVMPFKAQQIHPQLAQAQQQAVQAASGGIMGYSLGGYAAGGRQPRLLKGPGDGMSDNIPATIADRQPARLADGEFVVPADVVSHLGNGSTDAGAKHLHKMMDQVRVARTGKKAQGTQINPNKYLPK